jgi:hypothetical protein
MEIQNRLVSRRNCIKLIPALPLFSSHVLADSGPVFGGYETVNPIISEDSAAWVFLSLKAYGLCPLQMMESGPLIPKFSLRFIESTDEVGAGKIAKSTNVFWLRVDRYVSQESIEGSLSEGAKGSASSIRISGTHPYLDSIMKTRSVRLDAGKSAQILKMVRSFQKMESFVRVDELKRQSETNNFLIEVLIFGEFKVFMFSGTSQSLSEVISDFRVLFDDLLK